MSQLSHHQSKINLMEHLIQEVASPRTFTLLKEYYKQSKVFLIRSYKGLSKASFRASLIWMDCRGPRDRALCTKSSKSHVVLVLLDRQRGRQLCKSFSQSLHRYLQWLCAGCGWHIQVRQGQLQHFNPLQAGLLHHESSLLSCALHTVVAVDGAGVRATALTWQPGC